MSSPFAQTFMEKRPFSDEQYENLAKKYAKKEKKQKLKLLHLNKKFKTF